MNNVEVLRQDSEDNRDPSENLIERNINEQAETTNPVKTVKKIRRPKSPAKPKEVGKTTDVSTPQLSRHLTKLELLEASKELLIRDLFMCQVRGKSHDPATAERYAELLGVSEPPNITVIDENGTLYIGDGHHRVAAAILAGRTTVIASVYKGNKADAKIVGAEMNQSLPMTPADRKNMVEELLDNPNLNYSSAEIAAIAGVSKLTVENRMKDREKGDFLSIVNKTKRPKSAEEKLHDAAKSISKLFEKHGVDVLRTAWSSLPVHLREDITGFIDSGKDS